MIDRLQRLPIRIRITLTAAVTMGVLFGILALLLYLQFQSSLNASINADLRTRAGELSTLTGSAKASHTLPARLSRAGDDAAFAQILGPTGAVLAGTDGYRQRPLVSRTEISRALTHPGIIDRGERTRLYALRGSDGQLVISGISLNQQQDDFITFNWELLAGIPVMLVIAAVITYLVTGRLMAPVERMRRGAERISAEDSATRLPLPAADDEITALARTLNEMLERLHDGLERERRFIADASHDLRSPLAVLKGELEVALMTDRSLGPWRSAVDSAIEETDRVIALAEDLLILANAQDRALTGERVQIDIDDLLDDTAERYAAFAASNGRELSRLPSPTPLTLHADPVQLRRAYANLVANALQHGDGTVVLSATLTDQAVEIAVRDHGPGIPDAFLALAFERFTRADPARGRGGVGLGLSIADSIAVAHGGSAHIHNADHGGVRAWLSFPRSDVTRAGTAS